MKWLPMFFRCGRIQGHDAKAGRGADSSHLVNEPTRSGESPGESTFFCPGEEGSVTISIKKKADEILGIRLFYHSLQIQRIEANSALIKHSSSIPVGSSIISVNGKIATIRNIRTLLRECRHLSEVSIVIQQSALQQPHHRLSQSSATGSGSHVTPSPSQLSSMWRRASETATLAVSDSSVVPVPIDFEKLSRDSMGMWTRGIVRDSSLPDLPIGEDVDSFEAEYGESPNTWRARRRAKRASWSGTYPEAQEP